MNQLFLASCFKWFNESISKTGSCHHLLLVLVSYLQYLSISRPKPAKVPARKHSRSFLDAIKKNPKSIEIFIFSLSYPFMSLIVTRYIHNIFFNWLIKASLHSRVKAVLCGIKARLNYSCFEQSLESKCTVTAVLMRLCHLWAALNRLWKST